MTNAVTDRLPATTSVVVRVRHKVGSTTTHDASGFTGAIGTTYSQYAVGGAYELARPASGDTLYDVPCAYCKAMVQVQVASRSNRMRQGLLAIPGLLLLLLAVLGPDSWSYQVDDVMLGIGVIVLILSFRGLTDMGRAWLGHDPDPNRNHSIEVVRHTRHDDALPQRDASKRGAGDSSRWEQ